MKCVIFDMDGTLIDSRKAICITVNQIRHELGLNGDLDAGFIVEAINEPGRNIAKEFYGINDKPDMKLRDSFETKFKENYNKFASAYDGVERLLTELKNDGCYLVLASNAPQETLAPILKNAKIHNFFDFIIGSSLNVPQKPDPTMLKISSKMCNFDSVIFVGDSKKDELAALNANMAYLNVCWGFSNGSNSANNVKTIDEALLYIRNFSKI